MKNQKGFTLIELLIVIVIIGVLAVAFLPTLLGAPAKARDTQRIADVQKVQTVLINANLEGTAYPTGDSCIDTAWATTATITDDLGGSAPSDPVATTTLDSPGDDCTGQYLYVKYPTGSNYSFGIFAEVEDPVNQGNVACGSVLLNATSTSAQVNAATLETTGSATTTCYGVLVK